MKEETIQITTKLNKRAGTKLRRMAKKNNRTIKSVLEILIEQVDDNFPLEPQFD